MNTTLRSALRMILRVTVAAVAIAALIALAVMVAAQFWPEASNATIRWDDHATQLTGVFSSGIIEFLFAWLLMTMAILMGIAIMMFAFAVTALALGATGFLLAMPLIAIVAVVWFIARRSHRTPSSGGNLSPGA